MNTLLERWCESRPWHRVLCWCMGSLLAGLAAWGALLRPVDRQCAERQRQLIEEVSTHASLWPVVRKGPFRPDAVKARELAPFSPLDFQNDETTLVRWKPLQNGGELTLDAEWQAIPELFFPSGTAGCGDRRLHDCATRHGVTPAAGAGTCEIARDFCWFVPCCC